MNYLKIYKQLINKRRFDEVIVSYKDDPTQKYSEKHHIIPKTVGGSDKKFNLVRLYPREHYIAHLLLWKICFQKYGEHSTEYRHVLHALKLMRLNNDFQTRYFHINSRLYESLKNKWIKVGMSEEARKKTSERMKGKGNPMFGLYGKDNPSYGSKRTDEQRLKMKKFQMQYAKDHPRPKGQEHWSYDTTTVYNETSKQFKTIHNSELQIFLNNGWIHKGRTFTKETRIKMSNSAKKKIITEQHKKNIGIGVSKMFHEHPELINQISKSISKLIWIKRENECFRILPEQFSENGKYKPSDGWVRGRIAPHLSNLIWVHKTLNGELIKKRVTKQKLQSYLDSGYVLGSAIITHRKEIKS